MEHGGAHRTAAWYRKVRADADESFEVAIPHPPALEIRD
jgi:hypothetical protein